jgi:hypothetical protein
VKSLAHALQAAHEARVIHRDLKPANVLLTERGEPKVTDFGLAKKLDEQGATRTGSVMGTPSYMPPEQAEGKKDIGPAADVYALGAILYECLASRPPFRAATALDTILQVVSEEPPPLRRLNPQTPVDLETIAHKCLQKDPAKRYSTARDLAGDLERYLNGEPIRARPVGAIERVAKWVRRHKAVSALAGAVVLLLVVGSIVSSYFALTANKEAKLARNAEKTAETNLKAAEAEKARAEERFRRATFEQARAERFAGKPHRALELLASLAVPDPSPEMRAEAAEAVLGFGLRLVSSTPRRATVDVDGPYELIQFSADSSLQATTDTSLREANAANGEPNVLGVLGLGIRVYEVSTGKPLAAIECDTQRGLTFHPIRPALAVSRD